MAINWTKGYQVTFEYWEVDPGSFANRRRLTAVESSEITRDVSDETLGDATMTLGEFLDEETYIRIYLCVTQGNDYERIALGTFLAQTPTAKMDGKAVERPLELSTPLKELADDCPPPGYTVRKNADAIAAATTIFSRHHVRVKRSTASATMPRDVVANDSDTWLSFGKAVLEAVDMELTLDPYGEVGFAPVRDSGALAESWTFADDAISILMPEAELTCDWHEVPNTVEVIVSDASSHVRAVAVNDDPDSPVSTVRRGRTVLERVMNPEGVSTQSQANSYARRKLRELSCSERTLTYTHGYCPVRIGDCVRIAYGAHSFDCRAKVVRQVIRCSTDLEVEETAKYAEVLWNG